MKKTLFLNLGYKCNYDCVYCVIGGIKEEFNSDDFVSIDKIKTIELDGYNSVWLTGGEPTINPDFFEILDYFNNKKFDIHIQTNGSMLGNEIFFFKIKNYNINYQLPLNSLNEKIHNTIMKHKNAFNLTMNGIKNLLDNGFGDNLTVKLILTKLNYNHLDKTVLFLNSIGVKNFYISYPVLKGNFLNYLNKLVPKYSEISPFLDNLSYIEKTKDIHYVLESFPYCIVNISQYKNVWEIGQFNENELNKLSISEVKNISEISNNCFKKFGYRSEDRDCNSCKIINLKERLNNVSFLHKGLDKEINANCLDNIHKVKKDSCLNCNYNIICSGVSKEYDKLFGFGEFNPEIIKTKITKKNILNYLKYVRKV